MEVVERMCDSIALIDRGRKVLDGPLVEVKKRHGRNTVALSFEGDANFVATLPGVLRASDHGHFMEIQLTEGADPQMILREAAARLRVSRFEVVEPSLRDIFLAVTGGKAAPAA